MKLRSGTTHLKSHVRIPRRSRKALAIRSGALITTIIVTVVATHSGSEPPSAAPPIAPVPWPPWVEIASSAIRLDYPVHGVGLERDTIEIAGSVTTAAPTKSSVMLDVNASRYEIPLHNDRFRATATKLNAGWNLFQAELDANNCDMVGVIAPRWYNHFDYDAEGWTSNGGLVKRFPNAGDDQNADDQNGYLSCVLLPQPVDLIFVIDHTVSMRDYRDVLIDLCNRLIKIVKDNSDEYRVGVVTFRDREADHSDSSVQDTFPTHCYGLEPRTTLSELEFLKKKYFAGGGNSQEEDQYLGITEALCELERSQTGPPRQKLIIVASDAPPLSKDPPSIKEIQIQAVGQNAKIYSIVLLKKYRNRAEFDKAIQVAGELSKTNRDTLGLRRVFPVEFKQKTASLDKNYEANRLKKYIENAVLELDFDREMVIGAAPGCRAALKSAYGEYLFISLKNLEAPQVVLRGVNKTLFGTLRPIVGNREKTDSWKNYKICIDRSAKWTTSNAQKKSEVDEDTIRDVLKNLESVSIRGQVKSSSKSASLDRFIITPASEITGPTTYRQSRNEDVDP